MKSPPLSESIPQIGNGKAARWDERVSSLHMRDLLGTADPVAQDIDFAITGLSGVIPFRPRAEWESGV